MVHLLCEFPSVQKEVPALNRNMSEMEKYSSLLVLFHKQVLLHIVD
jgi:hypothetical protein